VSPDASWSFAPGVLILVGAAGWVYVARWRKSRRTERFHRPSVGRLVLYLGGLVTLLIALVSPVDSLGDQILAMHMVQHLLLIDIAPILLILGLTKVILRPVTRRIHTVERRAGFLASPIFALLLYCGAIWAWHIPALYDATVRHTGIHVVEHLTFSIVGFLYWWHVLSPIRSRFRLGGLGPVVYMASTKLVLGFLGIVITFAPDVLYKVYEGHRYWGMSPHADQQVAGALMAVEQSLVMGIALAVLFIRVLGEADTRDLRTERQADSVAQRST
jgi:cytochrome c oxidase assembly factor CtaG